MDVVINLLKNNYKKSTANTRLLQWLGLGFFLRKNAVNSNLICMFVMVSLEFQATDSKRGNVIRNSYDFVSKEIPVDLAKSSLKFSMTFLQVKLT